MKLKTCVQVVVASLALAAVCADAQASLLGSLKKVVNKTVAPVEKAVVAPVENMATGAARTVNSTVIGPAGAMAQSDFNTLKSDAQTAYSSTRGAVVSGYNTSVSQLTALGYDIEKALFLAAGKAAIGNNKGTLTTLQSRMKNLSASGRQALTRVQAAIAAKQLNEQVRTDMAAIATELGLIAGKANSNIPGNVTHSSFGVFTSSGSAAIVGFEESYGIVMNTFLENGKFSVGLTQSVGGSLGASLGDSVQAGLFWQPGSIDDAGGASVGFSVEAALGPGASAGLSWSVSKGMKGAENAIPGFAMSFSPGAELSAAFTGGYTQLLGKF